MILGYYAGYLETDLDKAFRYVAWGSQYTGNIQFDPIFGCISHFLRRARDKNIWIKTPFERSVEKIAWNDLGINQLPCLFILAGESGEVSLSTILKYVERGSNLMLLSSDDIEIRAAEHRMSNDLKQFYKQFHELTGTKDEDRKHQITISKGQGNIFFVDARHISDAQIEPGPFGGWSLEKQIKGLTHIDEELQRVGTFSIPCVDCQVHIPEIWPRGESLIAEFTFLNRSSEEIKQVNASLQLTPGIEPLSLIDFEISSLQPHQMTRRSLAVAGDEGFSAHFFEEPQKEVYKTPVVLVPQDTGIIHDPFEIHLTYENISREIPLPPIKLEILESLPKLVRSIQPPKTDLVASFHRFEKYFAHVTSASTLLELMNIDPASVVQKIRQIGEYIVRLIAKRKLLHYDPKMDFATLNQALYKQKIISDKAKGYIETIRYIGNLASHPSGNKFDKEDTLIVSQALILFMQEAIDKSLFENI